MTARQSDTETRKIRNWKFGENLLKFADFDVNCTALDHPQLNLRMRKPRNTTQDCTGQLFGDQFWEARGCRTSTRELSGRFYRAKLIVAKLCRQAFVLCLCHWRFHCTHTFVQWTTNKLVFCQQRKISRVVQRSQNHLGFHPGSSLLIRGSIPNKPPLRLKIDRKQGGFVGFWVALGGKSVMTSITSKGSQFFSPPAEK